MPTAPSQTGLEWCSTEQGLIPVLHRGSRTEPVVWAPQPGSQIAFLKCPVFEVLYEGERGPGKSDGLIFDFLRDVGKGYGAAWRGILFRRTYKELEDIITKCKRWIPQVFPRAKYNEGNHTWTFPDGEQLLLRYLMRTADYWSYHGHAYPWLGFEELCTWPDDTLYTRMFSCCRSDVVGVPKRVRATANPYGIGHNWVKSRFRLKGVPRHTKGPVIRDSRDRLGKLEPERCYVHGKLSENRILLHADPAYPDRLRAAANSEAEYDAWTNGNWNIVAGGMINDVWDDSVHVVPNIPLHLLPRRWYLDRSYDHGSSSPFSVGWWAQSNGEPFEYEGHKYGTVPGDLYRIAEWYGWTGKENEGLRMYAGDIARGIVDRERDWGIYGRVKDGPADTQIFDPYEAELTVAGDMEAAGVTWERADKSPGSRVQGWEQLRKWLRNAKPVTTSPREQPGLFIMERCEQFQRTVPVLPRDERNMDDVLKGGEDHVGDETRYRLRFRRKAVRTGVFK